MTRSHIHRCTFFDDGDLELVCVCGTRGVVLVDDDAPEGMLVVVGPNGEGKTNLLEGMSYLFTLSSPRVSSNQPLVREGADAGYVRGEVETAVGRTWGG